MGEDGAEQLAQLEAQRARQDEEIRALRSELAMARAEAEQLRDAQGQSRVATISIGRGAQGRAESAGTDMSGASATDLREGWIEPEQGEVVVAEPVRGEGASRPMLRVRGVPSPEAPSVQPATSAPPSFASASGMPALPTTAALPPVHPAASAPPSFAPATASPAATTTGVTPSTLPAGSAPVPAALAAGGSTSQTAIAAAPSAQADQDRAVQAYRGALAHLRDRDYAAAVAGFDAFLEAHSRHAYAGNALYWRAEAIYAQRRYRDALHAFEVFVQRNARHSKVADALLKMGLCHSRSGDSARARVFFRRVQQEFPDTVAARLASREEAS